MYMYMCVYAIIYSCTLMHTLRSAAGTSRHQRSMPAPDGPPHRENRYFACSKGLTWSQWKSTCVQPLGHGCKVPSQRDSEHSLVPPGKVHMITSKETLNSLRVKINKIWAVRRDAPESSSELWQLNFV